MNDEVVAWATRLAEAVAPDEADLVPDITAAFLAGGKERAELFRTSASVPGGFDAGAVLVVFPFVLSAVSAAGAAIKAFLGSGILSVPGAVKDLLDLRAHFRRSGATHAGIPGNQGAYQAMDHVCEVIEAELGKAGMGRDERDLLSYRIVRHLLDDVGGTDEFLAAVGEAAGRSG